MDTDKTRDQRVIDFFNHVIGSSEIVEGIKDDPGFGKSSRRAYGIRPSLARKILAVRDSLPGGKFTSVKQIDSIPGVGPDTMHDIYFSLQAPSDAYPILLFPVRLETRFRDNELWVRFYPDQIAIETHVAALSEQEIAAVNIYHATVSEAESEEDRRAAWRVLAHRYGPERAAWIIKSLSEPETAQLGQTRTPSARALPDRFVVCLYKNNECVYQQEGNPITDELPLMANQDPSAPGNDDEGLFDKESRWVVDFQEAIDKGMAVRIQLAEDDDGHFSRVLVVGYKASKDPAEGQRLLEELIENHHYTSGLSFLRHGTPTNNTKKAKTEYAETTEDLEDSYLIECGNAEIVLDEGSNAKILTGALGINSDLLKCIKYAHDTDDSYAGDMQKALWPVTGNYFLSTMLSIPLNNETTQDLWQHYWRFVRARGPLPSIRIGNQPYGILPVTQIKGWQASELDTPTLDEGSGTRQLQFDRKLHAVLDELYDKWTLMAMDHTKVPRIGTGADPDRELVSILAMEPASSSYRIQPIVDDRYIGWFLFELREHFFGSQSVFGRYDNDSTYWVKQWAETWLQSKETILQLLTKLAEFAGVTDWSANETPALRVFGWGEGFDLPVPLVRDPSNAESETGYLKTLVDTDGESPEDANTLLLDLLKRSFAKYTGLEKEEAEYDHIKQATNRLSQLDSGAVEKHLRDTLDLTTHRLDAWISSFATKRLHAMRERNSNGIFIGAYGWVEDLRRQEQSVDDEEGGYIHAPSIAQAAAGAVLRSAYLTHRGTTEGNTFRINLTSDRVRRALHILDGVRQGQELGALLGYRFERGLHDQSQDVYIDAFRSVFPLKANKVVQPIEGETVEAVAARNVVDGLALANRWTTKKDRFLDLIQAEGVEKPGPRVIKELDRLLDTLDSVTDVLLEESVFQSVQGNYDRAGAAMDAASGSARPPEIESVRTPVSGVGLSHRIGVVFDGTQDAGSGPRAMAEPRLNSWIEDMLGDMSKIGCHVRIDEVEGDAQLVTLADLNINPLDFLYLSAAPPVGEETEIEQRIAYYVRQQNDGADPNSTIQIDFSRKPGTFTRSIAEASELARQVLNLLGGSTFLKPESLIRPEDASGLAKFTEADYLDLRARVEQASDTLDNPSETTPGLLQRIELASEEAIISSLLLQTAQFGIDGVIPSAPSGDTELSKRKNLALSQISKRIVKCKNLLETAQLAAHAIEDNNPDGYKKPIDILIDAIKALFGEAFVVLPTFTATNSQELQLAINQSEILGQEDNHRISLWLQQVSQTHTPVRRLEDVLMFSEAWKTAAINSDSDCEEELDEILAQQPMLLRVMQLPYDENRRWLALSDEELLKGIEFEEFDTRPRGVLSIVSLVPDNIDFGKKISGLLIDDWSEFIPSDKTTTGISFQYDQPNTQAPQALLLAVPGQLGQKKSGWTPQALQEIVKDTMDLAKVRTVDLDAFRDVGRLFPALFLSTDPNRPGWERDVTMPSLNELLVKLIMGGQCIDFEEFDNQHRFPKKFQLRGFTFYSMGGFTPYVQKMALGEVLDDASPGTYHLKFGSEGIRINPLLPVFMLEIVVRYGSDTPPTIQVLNDDGTVLEEATIQSKRIGYTARFSSGAIAPIEIKGTQATTPIYLRSICVVSA